MTIVTFLVHFFNLTDERLSDKYWNDNRSHFPSIILTQSTQFRCELWGLVGMAIATFTPNNNERPHQARTWWGLLVLNN